MTDRNSTRPTSTAYHEAGHAVAHIRLRIEQHIITIEPTLETLGRAIAKGPDHVWDEQAAADQVRAFVAGYAALVAAGYSHELAMEGADDDMAQAEYLIEFWGLQPDLATGLSRLPE